MRPADEHLTPREFGLLLLSVADSKNSSAAGTLEPAAQQHLEGCAACQSRADRYRRVEEALSAMRISVSSDPRKALPGPDCASEESCLRIAAGLMNDDEAARLLSHAAVCRRCGALLKKAMQDLSEHTTVEEEETLSRLPMSSPQWQHTTALRLAAQSRSSEQAAEPARDSELVKVNAGLRGGLQRFVQSQLARRRLAYGFTALVAGVCVLFLWAWQQSRQPDSVNSLLNEAYSQRRNLQMRFAGAQFGPVKIERTSSSHLTAPPSLLEAEKRISIYKHSDNSEWLLVQGRAQLLEGEYDEAISTLERAHQLSQSSVPVLIDLASAHFQAALARNSDIDYGMSLSYLADALALDPHNPVVLFNRAIAEEKTFLYAKAKADWEEYLKLDPNSDWANEARQRLKDVDEKLKSHALSNDLPLLELGSILDPSGILDEARKNGMERRIEEYYETALPDWLPQAYRVPGQINGLRAFATLMAENHDDWWLKEFLSSTPRSQNALLAVEKLSQAIHANIRHDSTQSGYTLAREAKQLFSSIHSKPGILRALQEEIYSLRLSFESRRCVELAQKLDRMLLGTKYHFMATQVLLEETSCRIRSGDAYSARQALIRASTEADLGRYPSQQINVLNYQADMHSLEGDWLTAWQQSRTALNRFWEGTYPAKRAYSFYIRLATWAEQNQLWQVFVLFMDQATQLIDRTDLTAFRAMAHFHLAQGALGIQDADRARYEFDLASELFRQVRQVKEADIARANVEFLLASSEAETGYYDSALERLDRFAPHLASIESVLVYYDFYVTKAKILSSHGDNKQAEAEYGKAFAAAEELLKHVSDERERLAWSRQFGSAYRGLSEALALNGDPQRALNVWELYRASDLRSFIPVNLREINASDKGKSMGPLPAFLESPFALPELNGRVALIYMITSKQLLIWVISGQHIELKTQPVHREELLSLSRRLSRFCNDREGELSQIQADAKRLYGLLIRPVEEQIKGAAALVIEPDDELSNLPFEVLLDGNGKYLVETKALAYIPSIHYLEYSKKGWITYPKILAVGISSISEEYKNALAPLEDSETEAMWVADRFASHKALTGKDATAENIHRAISTANIFHVATHSIYKNGYLTLLVASPERSGPSIPLDFGKMNKGELKACYLVVLSACSTAGSLERTIHSPGNTVRSILQAGVPYVVASRWKVDSHATMTIMKDFYGQLSDAETPDRALQYAAIRALKEYGHPFYWAAFSQYGR